MSCYWHCISRRSFVSERSVREARMAEWVKYWNARPAATSRPQTPHNRHSIALSSMGAERLQSRLCRPGIWMRNISRPENFVHHIETFFVCLCSGRACIRRRSWMTSAWLKWPCLSVSRAKWCTRCLPSGITTTTQPLTFCCGNANSNPSPSDSLLETSRSVDGVEEPFVLYIKWDSSKLSRIEKINSIHYYFTHVEYSWNACLESETQSNGWNELCKW